LEEQLRKLLLLKPACTI